MKKKTDNNIPRSEEIRLQKAKIILSHENAIEEINCFFYIVKSQSGVGNYRVEWNGIQWVCNCPDFIKNGHIEPCKHIVALELFLDTKFEGIDEKELESSTITYPQDWSRYNQAQIMEFELFDQFLYQLVSLIEETKKTCKGRPSLKLADQIFCCIMKEYSQLSSRRAKHLYNEAVQRQQISCNPHFNVVTRTLNKKEMAPLLHRLVQLSAQPLASIEADFAIDSSGFRCSSFGAYCEYMHNEKRMHNWLKAHICTGVYTNVVTDIVITDENAGDSPQFKKLIRNTAKNFPIGEVCADMAYSSRKNYEIVGQYGGTAYIPFKKNATGGSRGSPLWKRAYHYFQLHKDEFMEHYHKRSNVESTFSAIKKKFGETIKSKNRVAQENELLCKIIAYNLTVLIHEMIELDGISDFLSFNGLKKEVTIKDSNGFGDTGGKINGI
jgi:transposase/predicted nucleic acid-binding Zn finger protein